MSSLRLLNKVIFLLLLPLIILPARGEEEAIDIWKTDSISDEKINEIIIEDNSKNESKLYETIKPVVSNIKEEKNLEKIKQNIFGLFDPEENNLNINMWINSDGKIILEKLNKIDEIKLSKDTEDILLTTLFTNSYSPEKNIEPLIFLDFKSKWLIKNKKNKIIENYLLKNPGLMGQSILVEYLVNEFLSEANVDKACEKTKFINADYQSEYLDLFSIYCLTNENKIEEAQLKFDLLTEKDFENNFYENKINFLLGYLESPDIKVSDKNLFEFYLSHIVNSDFKYEPNERTSKEIWRYLSAANLIYTSETVDIEDEVKINLLEKATSDGSYDSNELFNIYKKIMFNINQFLDIENSYKSLPNFKARALLYQAVLLSDNYDKKMQLILKLNALFEKDNIGNVALNEIKIILSEIDREEISEKYLDFYDYYLKKEEEDLKKIKFNNNIIHRSKLLKYFIDEKYKVKNLEKDLESVYKKIKKNKDYFFSIQDIILLESLKADGFKIPRKIEKLYSLENLTIPENLINLNEQNEQGLFLLNIVEMVGEDKFVDLDADTLYFIISSLNKFNFKKLRNNIIAKSFPERS